MMVAPTVSARIAIAQDASIAGTVVDAAGNTLPGVTAEARNQASDDVATASTDGSGQFTIGMLVPGRYRVTFSLPGFQTVVRDDVEVGTGTTVTLDVVTLAVGDETVVIIGPRAEPGAGMRPDPAAVAPTTSVERDGLPTRSETDITSQLEAVDPSFNRDDTATIGGTGSLLNMSPDHTLVLVNGKRRHRGAVIAWLGNGMFARVAGIRSVGYSLDRPRPSRRAPRRVDDLRSGSIRRCREP